MRHLSPSPVAFIALTARDGLEVVNAETNRHVATLQGLPGAAGIVADKDNLLVTTPRSALRLSYWFQARC
jgi:hypothetical protein